MHPDRDITYFARTNHRNIRTPFGIRRADRRNHMYVIGKTGTGKSTLAVAVAVSSSSLAVALGVPLGAPIP